MINDTDAEQLAGQLQAQYPLTVSNFLAMPDGAAALQHLYGLNQGWRRFFVQHAPANVITYTATPPPADEQFDIIFAGGGLGLLDAALLTTHYRRRVLVFDRKEIGATHREWNISAAELARLVELGLFSWAELEPIIQRRYQRGVVRFSAANIKVAPADLLMEGVLDVALDASALLALCVRKIRESTTGSVIMPGYSFRHAYVMPAHDPAGQVVVEVESISGGEICHFAAPLLVDDMGSTSPLAIALNDGQPFSAVCPTVGTVAAGFVAGKATDELDPDSGDILVSIADAEKGRQLIWEGFPGQNDEMTVYVFYYDTLEPPPSLPSRGRGLTPVPKGGTGGGYGPHPAPSAGLPRGGRSYDLLELFEDYFRLLPGYKKPGPNFHHLKPVYGFIPARHRDRISQRQGTAATDRIISVGDAAAQQSPLTFCGFGSHVRNLGRIDSLLDLALEHNLLDAGSLAQIGAHQQNLSMMWVFSRFMSPSKVGLYRGERNEVNQIMNVFCRVLGDLGPDISRRFFQDTATLGDFTRIILHTARVYPPIFPLAVRTLGWRRIGLWALDYLGAVKNEAQLHLYRKLARLVGRRSMRRLEGSLLRIAPRLGLRLRARRLGWAVQRKRT
jgi:lycopene cyclase CruA